MVLKGALISFMPTFIGATPNVVIFQINPETITHSWNSADPTETDNKTGADPLAVAGLPGETFEFTLAMDANDTIADGGTTGSTRWSPRRAASTAGLRRSKCCNIRRPFPARRWSARYRPRSAPPPPHPGRCGQTTPQSVPRLQVPTVLFVWGLGRIVPVRVTGLTVTERLYDRFLNPTHAEAQLTLQVLTLDDLVNVPQPMKAIAKAAYTYTQALRQGLALTNLSGPTATLLGMLPISSEERAMFFSGSRYAGMTTYPVVRPDGSTVSAVSIPLPGPAVAQGYHRRLGGQRLDHIANRYLGDPTGFWQLCDANNAVVPDALANADLVGIPLNAATTN